MRAGAHGRRRSTFAWSRITVIRVGKTLLEVPAGTIDEGESPEQTAERELQEETGYRAGTIRRLRDWYVSPGVMTERMYLFLCEDLEPAPAPRARRETQDVIVPWDRPSPWSKMDGSKMRRPCSR